MPFKKLREQHIPALQAVAEVYEDTNTGAMHYHLAAKGKENVFLVAFPTIPSNSDGRAHILEHLALCGSSRFPVRDPFFSMTRRSMATFMNAMTYAEKTVYPFASQDKTDFFNLLDVYLDAAFFPNLDYLDFLQEGWRYAYDDDKLVYQGVVFNEMKGAFANPTRALVQGLESALYEGTTYAVVSGGDPLDIPKLTHADLKEFHATHYHPSQAVFMTYGDLSASLIQSHIENKVTSKFSGKSEKMRPQKSGDFLAPKEIIINLPSQCAKEDEYGIHYAWRMGDMTDIVTRYRCELLSSALMGDAAAPLQMAMESAGMGRPAGYNGLDSSMREMALYIGMEGLREDQIVLAQKLIWQSLRDVAENGVPYERLASVLRDFEFQQQEVSGGRTPFGLKRLLEGLPVEMNGGDPLLIWDNAAALAQIRAEIADPNFMKTLVRELMSNMNRVDAVIHPDKDYFSKRDQQEQVALKNAEARITEQQKQQILFESAALQKRQAAPMNTACLPKISVKDVSPTPVETVAYEKMSIGDKDMCYKFSIPSNGVSYYALTYNMSHVPEELWQWLTLYSDLLPGLGADSMTFAEAEAWRHSLAPAFRTTLEADSTYQPGAPLKIGMTFSTKGMARDSAALCEMLSTSIAKARFDEFERIQFLVESTYEDAMQSVTENGNAYASNLLRKGFSKNGHFQYQVNGLPYLSFLEQVNEMCQSAAGFKQVQSKLEQLHQMVLSADLRVVVAATDSDLDKVHSCIIRAMKDIPRGGEVLKSAAPFEVTSTNDTVLYGKSQVNHCYQAWSAPAIDHADAPALAVLASFVENGYLHRALREDGGAYGGSAGYHGTSRVFTMSSYRDPRFSGTYNDFQKAIDWVLNSEHCEEALEEAIISTVQGMDKPASPYGDALLAVKRDSLGMSEELRKSFRKGILQCTIDDLKRAASSWLKNASSTRCAYLGIESQIPEAMQMGFELKELADVA